MITMGIIKEINISDENHKNYKYQVELPVFSFPGQTNKDLLIYTATCSLPGGLYSSYKKGDKVYVGFINNDLSSPVILGKIYQGLTEEDRTYAYLNSLKVESSVILPEDTKIGELTYKDLNKLKNLEGIKNDIITLNYPKGIIITMDPEITEEELLNFFPGTLKWEKVEESSKKVSWKRIS